jgi:drug/metabolite transporter (DMT)-like permease
MGVYHVVLGASALPADRFHVTPVVRRMTENVGIRGSAFRKSRALCWAILFASGIIYGSSFSFMKIAVAGGASLLGMVFWFAILATSVLAVELAVTGKLKSMDIQLFRFCLPWGILSVVLPNLFFFYAAREIQASLIALGIALVPILTLTGAILLKRERLTLRRSVGIGLGAAAVLMVLVPRTSLPEAGDAVFVLIAFAGAACYAAEHLYIEACAPTDVGVDQLLFLMFSSVSILLLPIVLATGTFFVPRWPLGASEVAMLAVAAVTLLDYFFITLLILWAGPVFTSQAAYIVTLAGVMWGIIIFRDSHSLWVWAAIGALMLGLACVRPRMADR